MVTQLMETFSNDYKQFEQMPTAEKCTFENNSATYAGGAVYDIYGNIDHYDKKLNEEYHDAWKKLQEKMEIELEDKKLPIDERTKKELPIGRINP